MDATMNIRKKRLLEAISQGAIPKSLATPKQERLEKILDASMEPNAKRAKTVYAQISTINEMKLKVLENWEVTKRRAIERLAEEIEELQEIEEKIGERERDLAERGIRINEEIFKNYCTRANTSSPELGKPLNMSTPKTVRPTKKPLSKISNKTMSMSNKAMSMSDKTMSATSKAMSATSKPMTTSSKAMRATTTTPPSRTLILPNIAANEDENETMVTIGPNGTKVSKAALNAINWSLAGAAVTRKILMEVFDRETLAFHTLTGKPSPAFMDCDKPLKNQLDPAKVADIIHIVTQNLNMSAKEVRSAITTKCADENKMYRQRERKRLSKEQAAR